MCNLLSIPFSVGFCKMNCATLSKTLASSVSFTEVLVIPGTAQLCPDCGVLRVVSISSQDNLLLFSKETCILEKSISPGFPAQRKSDQFVLVATVPLQTRLRLRPFRIQRGVDRGGSMVVTSVLQISHFGSFGHVGEPRSFRRKHAALSRYSLRRLLLVFV